jgi:predicted dehydrogenase
MNKLRTAVIGCGHLERIHARLANTLPELEVVAVVDPVREAREALGKELNVPAVADYREAAYHLNAAFVVTPTREHHAVARDLLHQGVHVFVEKPITLTATDADELIAAANSADRVLQVGHVERFNPGLVAARPYLAAPRFLQATRTSTYTFRSTDIGVVLDLMIHDLDVILSLVDSDVVGIEACGETVFGPHEDIAHARLTFANGCLANLTASRVSPITQRTLVAQTPAGYVNVDFGARCAQVLSPCTALRNGDLNVHALSVAEKLSVREKLFQEYLPLTTLPGAECNAILEEQREFCRAMLLHEPVTVSGEAGRKALAVAEQIQALITGQEPRILSFPQRRAA